MCGCYRKASTSGEARSLRPMPYREREIRSNLKLGSHEVRVKNEEVVRGLNEKEIYPDMTAALMKIDQTSTAVLVTKRARNAIAKDLSVVKEVCHTVSKQCIRETKHLVQVCKRATRANVCVTVCLELCQ
ncbi:hypothetical protein EON65_11145 [archaeon]|nr:MAG: hypothetical protein EON65_11145 [archaeon]